MKKVFKMFLYTNYKKEEEWLNLMSQKGGILVRKNFLYIILKMTILRIFIKNVFYL